MVTLIVEADGQPAGFAQLAVRRPPPDACRGPPRWRSGDSTWTGPGTDWGVAQALMAAVRREAVSRGGRTLWLAVWERNERAKGFYRKCGFLDVGSQPFILGEDHQTDLVMVSDLAQATIEATT